MLGLGPDRLGGDVGLAVLGDLLAVTGSAGWPQPYNSRMASCTNWPAGPITSITLKMASFGISIV